MVGTGVLLGRDVAVAGPGVFVAVPGVRLGVSVGTVGLGVSVSFGVLEAGGVVSLIVGFGVEDALEDIKAGAEYMVRFLVFPEVVA